MDLNYRFGHQEVFRETMSKQQMLRQLIKIHLHEKVRIRDFISQLLQSYAKMNVTTHAVTF